MKRVHYVDLGRASVILSMLGAIATAAAEATVDVADRACRVHAAAMVAEMQAGTAEALGDNEKSLIRATAMKSCLAQTQPDAATADAASAVPQPAPGQVTPVAQGRTGGGFWDELLHGSSGRNAGHERLRRRGRH